MTIKNAIAAAGARILMIFLIMPTTSESLAGSLAMAYAGLVATTKYTASKKKIIDSFNSAFLLCDDVRYANAASDDIDVKEYLDQADDGVSYQDDNQTDKGSCNHVPG